jgi:hypothetical protein
LTYAIELSDGKFFNLQVRRNLAGDHIRK